MEIAASDVDVCELVVGDGDACWVARLIKTTANGEAAIGAGGGDQFDDDLVGEQGLASSVDSSAPTDYSLALMAGFDVAAWRSARGRNWRARSCSTWTCQAANGG